MVLACACTRARQRRSRAWESSGGRRKCRRGRRVRPASGSKHRRSWRVAIGTSCARIHHWRRLPAAHVVDPLPPRDRIRLDAAAARCRALSLEQTDESEDALRAATIMIHDAGAAALPVAALVPRVGVRPADVTSFARALETRGDADDRRQRPGRNGGSRAARAAHSGNTQPPSFDGSSVGRRSPGSAARAHVPARSRGRLQSGVGPARGGRPAAGSRAHRARDASTITVR